MKDSSHSPRQPDPVTATVVQSSSGVGRLIFPSPASLQLPKQRHRLLLGPSTAKAASSSPSRTVPATASIVVSLNLPRRLNLCGIRLAVVVISAHSQPLASAVLFTLRSRRRPLHLFLILSLLLSLKF
ncbi:hypothetical protein PIB30_053132 [Stylosanthes scabra]|uniref:Uncharacterized protein n=1 Tax=Stylosanthes scabra TaxID=79078 RepID=A0ABU6YIK7_9FABA|nr:hypothetical protein [Stylosanthes scabra]